MSERIFVIGAGKVGRGLTRAFRASGVTVIGLHARRENDEATSVGEYPASLSDANVVIIAVQDSQIDSVCMSLADTIGRKTGQLQHGAVVLHTSGTADPRNYYLLRSLGIPAGTFHPLVPFATSERGAKLVRDAWIGIDGDATACSSARRLAAAIGARTVNIPPGHKAEYHAAAVMASNFPIVLAAMASQVIARTGVPERTAEQVVQSLMCAAVGNLEYGPPRDVLTGPAARGDDGMVQRHLQALQNDPDAKAIYEIFSRIAMELVSKRK